MHENVLHTLCVCLCVCTPCMFSAAKCICVCGIFLNIFHLENISVLYRCSNVYKPYSHCLSVVSSLVRLRFFAALRTNVQNRQFIIVRTFAHSIWFSEYVITSIRMKVHLFLGICQCFIHSRIRLSAAHKMVEKYKLVVVMDDSLEQKI